VVNQFSHRSVVHGTELIDSTVSPGVKYFYTVATLTPAEGSRSEPIAVSAEHTPRMASLETISPTQLRITLTFEADRSRFASAFIAADDSITAQSVVSASPAAIIATFATALRPGPHTVKMQRMYALSGFEIDASQRLQFLIEAISVQHFGIVEAKLDGDKTIRLQFSGIVAAASLRKNNFTVRTSANVFSLADPVYDAADSAVVILRLEGGGSLTALGLRVEVVVATTVLSRTGIPLNDGKGQTLSFGINALSLDHPVVFPNPLHYLVGLQERITFVNIPTRCKVSIFTAAGRKVRDQADLSTPDGLSWDLRDDRGEMVASGIYLYRLVHIDDNGGVLESTMGKFAIIR
jgi:hypothetical protein